MFEVCSITIDAALDGESIVWNKQSNSVTKWQGCTESIPIFVLSVLWQLYWKHLTKQYCLWKSHLGCSFRKSRFEPITALTEIGAKYMLMVGRVLYSHSVHKQEDLIREICVPTLNLNIVCISRWLKSMQAGSMSIQTIQKIKVYRNTLYNILLAALHFWTWITPRSILCFDGVLQVLYRENKSYDS